VRVPAVLAEPGHDLVRMRRQARHWSGVVDIGSGLLPASLLYKYITRKARTESESYSVAVHFINPIDLDGPDSPIYDGNHNGASNPQP
jgi:hypothetical protein